MTERDLLLILLAASLPSTALAQRAGSRCALDGVDAADAALIPLPRPDWFAEGNQDYSLFGSSVGTAGDVNGDAYDDVIVGAANSGQAQQYEGSPTGLGNSPAWTAVTDQPGSVFGASVGTAGDVNGDGFDDVIVGAPLYTNPEEYEGRAYVYHGSLGGLSNGPNWTAESDRAGATFGMSVGTAGDVNGDGFDDVIVGAPGYENGQSREGAAYLYLGSATGLAMTPDWIAEVDRDSASLGWSVGRAGDVNGDGYADVIIGAVNDADAGGRAYAYYGSPTGLSTSPDWVAESGQVNAHFGYSVGTAGDVNHDGFADVIIGAVSYTYGHSEEGRAYVYLGSVAGLNTTPDWIADGKQEFAGFGFSVGTAGDVNGDGFDDVMVGAWMYHNGEFSEGRAGLYFGSATGICSSPRWSAESNQVGGGLGNSVGSAGDVNGDGFADGIIGAQYYSRRKISGGIALVYEGRNAGGCSSKTGLVR